MKPAGAQPKRRAGVQPMQPAGAPPKQPMRPAAGRGRSMRWAWGLVAVLALLVGWRLHTVPWRHLAGSPAPAVEDRRQHHFRNLTYTQTQRLVEGLLRNAYAASTPRERALALARVAVVQRERGLDEAAAAAAREATQLAGGDADVRSILAGPLRLEDIPPRE